MSTFHISPNRRMRVLSVGITASMCVYALLISVAEPLKSFAASSSDTVDVSVTVNSAISNSCTSPVTLGTIAGTGDSGAYNDSRATTCTVATNNTAGYTLGWQVTTGSGGAQTGHMINQYEDIIAAYTPAVDDTPETWSVGGTDAEWGARLSSTSDTTNTADFGTDAASEKWLNVATGSVRTIATRNNETVTAGDDQKIGFRAEVGSSNTTPTGTYQVTVVFTATTQ